MKKLSQFTAFAVLFLFFSFTLPFQNNSNQGEDNLVIHFTTEGERVNMECLKGCSWEKLTFDVSSEGPQFVGQNGMLQSADELRELRPGLVNFVFSVEKDEKGLSFTGYEGVSWKSTSAHCQRGGVECAIELTEKGVSTK